MLNSIPVSTTCLTSFPSFTCKKEVNTFLMKQFRVDHAAHTKVKVKTILTFEVASAII